MGGPNSASNQGRWASTGVWGLPADGKQSVQVESYPIPRIQEMAEGTAFMKLDLKHASSAAIAR